MLSKESYFDAVKSGDTGAVAAFLDEDPNLLNARSQDGISAVMVAIYYGEPLVAELLIERGAPLDLFEAAAAGRLERVKALVEAGAADVNAYAPDGFQPLGLAAFFGHPEVAFYLLEKGAQVDSPSRNPQNVRPLHSAVAARLFEIARALVERGADVNAVQQGGFSPLHGAAQNGQLEMVRLLLDHGADPSMRDSAGRSPLDFTIEGGYTEVSEILGKNLTTGN